MLNPAPRDSAEAIIKKIRELVKLEIDQLDDNCKQLTEMHVYNHLSRSCFNHMQKRK